MKLHLSTPAKTFLLGEYIALQGGPVLVLNTQPRFKLRAKSLPAQSPMLFEHIHPASPAGKFLQEHAETFKGLKLIFEDPYHGLGGFGASSAQFLMVLVLQQLLTEGALQMSCPIEQLLKKYHHFAWAGEGFKPSGADLIAQAQGHISYFYKERNLLENLAWPFSDLNYYLIHTGTKLSTHHHLQTLTEFNTHKLADIVLEGQKSLQQADASGFIDSIKSYAQLLKTLDLVLPKTTDLLKFVEARAEVLAAKGCGALGADVILILVKARDHEIFGQWLKQQNLNLIASGNQASTGLEITAEIALTL